MSRKAKREAIRRVGPDFDQVVREAIASVEKSKKVDETIAKLGIQQGDPETQTDRMMIDLLRPDMPLYVETHNWVYVGIVNEVGRDYFILRQVSRVISDGRHHQMMTKGTAELISIEPSGGPAHQMVIPIDYLGPWCIWPFDMPDKPSA